MDRARTITLAITMITGLLCWLFIAEAQLTSEEIPTAKYTEGENAKESGDNSEEKNPTEESKQDVEKKRTFDFSPNGDDNLQSFNFMLKLPFDEKPFQFKSIEGLLSGKYFVTFQKPDPREGISLLEALRREFSEMEAISESFTLRLEGNTPDKIGIGGYIELESDYSIETDPHLHFTVYGRYSPYTFVEVGVGGWTEFRRLRKAPREDRGHRSGLRAHVDIKGNIKGIYGSMLLECLPHWSFDEFHISVSPELEFRFKGFGKQLGLVLHVEIDYYSKKKDFTLEPLLDLNPLEIRWTQLIRHRF